MPHNQKPRQQSSTGLQIVLVLLTVIVVIMIVRHMYLQPAPQAVEVKCQKDIDGNLKCIIENSQVQDIKRRNKTGALLDKIFNLQGVDGALQNGMKAEIESHNSSAAAIMTAALQKKPVSENQVADIGPYEKQKPVVNNGTAMSLLDRIEIKTGAPKVGGARNDAFDEGGMVYDD